MMISLFSIERSRVLWGPTVGQAGQHSSTVWRHSSEAGANITGSKHSHQTYSAAAALQINLKARELKINSETMAETELENQPTKAQNGKSPEASPEKKDERYVLSVLKLSS